MFTILNKEYPAPEASERSIITSLLFGLFIGLFLVLFEPFDINTLQYEYKTLKFLFFGFITAFVMLIFRYVLPLLWPEVFSDRHWKIKHEILFFLIILFFIANLNGLYINYLNSLKFSWKNYFWIIQVTMMLGSIPICFLVLINYNRMLKKYMQEGKQLQVKSTSKKASFTIKIPLETNQEYLIIDAETLLYIEADGNYIAVIEDKGHDLSKNLYRISLSRVEDHLNTDHILKCHRSFIVNLNKVTHIKGNAQGFKLTLANCSMVVPVSRKFVPIFKSYFSQKNTLSTSP